jgi:hypothetical protein
VEEQKKEGVEAVSKDKKTNWYQNEKNKKILLGAIIVVVLFGAYFLGKNPQLNVKKFFAKGITQDEAKAKVEKFIADNGGGATVKSVAEENGLYKVAVDANGQEIPTYVTKDGTKFFPQAIDFAEAEKKIAESKKQQEAASQPAPKNDKPAVDLYVMAFCPYGNKAEDTIKSVYDLLKGKVDFNFHYIVSVNGSDAQSLHGPTEVTQDEREACVLKNYGKDKWMSFVTYVNDKCGSDGSCWEAGAKSLAIDTAKINTCVSSQGITLLKAEADASTAAGATGSPTMTVNGQTTQAVYQYGNSEAYKKAICDAFNTAPAECSKTLSAGSAATSTTQGGSCN